jgi:uncharacterized protein (DUF2267 family)
MKAPIAINSAKFKKADFVSAVAVKTGMTKEQSKVALTAVLDVLASSIRINVYYLVHFKKNLSHWWGGVVANLLLHCTEKFKF